MIIGTNNGKDVLFLIRMLTKGWNTIFQPVGFLHYGV